MAANFTYITAMRTGLKVNVVRGVINITVVSVLDRSLFISHRQRTVVPAVESGSSASEPAIVHW